MSETVELVGQPRVVFVSGDFRRRIIENPESMPIGMVFSWNHRYFTIEVQVGHDATGVALWQPEKTVDFSLVGSMLTAMESLVRSLAEPAS